jgi:hypothetical protein
METLKRMLAEKLPIDLIAQIMDWSIEQIQQLGTEEPVLDESQGS